ncbi:hypothetical protein QBC35DRAFT_533862 [Podospora australis]|uniref:Ubiquitin 3 binding protein But2 C-terminal domain-containing protein n=1 Tax=Podospora australis TaxID=1536484 RepID=A0AAN6WPV9_9PEZI|nr:hypothetical protein QBC35DRAFT_533862 [Podospora australis]
MKFTLLPLATAAVAASCQAAAATTPEFARSVFILGKACADATSTFSADLKSLTISFPSYNVTTTPAKPTESCDIRMQIRFPTAAGCHRVEVTSSTTGDYFFPANGGVKGVNNRTYTLDTTAPEVYSLPVGDYEGVSLSWAVGDVFVRNVNVKAGEETTRPFGGKGKVWV